MTKRTEFQHRTAEFKARMMTRVANRLFSLRENGLDGFLKRRMLKPKQTGEGHPTNSETG